MIENEMDIGGNVIDAAKATQVDRLIFHSVLHTQVQALPLPPGTVSSSKKLLVESGVPFSILQVGSYYQNMLPGWARMLDTGVHAMAYEVEAPMIWLTSTTCRKLQPGSSTTPDAQMVFSKSADR